MASAKKIGEIIASIKAVYPYYAKETDVDVLAKTWMLLLKDIPDDVVRVAIIKCLQICKTPPTPADVLEQVREISTANAPTDEEMWVTLTKAVRKSQEHIYNFGHTLAAGRERERRSPKVVGRASKEAERISRRQGRAYETCKVQR